MIVLLHLASDTPGILGLLHGLFRLCMVPHILGVQVYRNSPLGPGGLCRWGIAPSDRMIGVCTVCKKAKLVMGLLGFWRELLL